jgi:uroporphyrinogen III methyltransferase/synthase
MPAALLAWVKEEVLGTDPDRVDAPQFSPAEGVPGDVAKVLLSAARSGLRAVHLVSGDPFEHDSVVKEAQAVARTAVPFEVVPGVSAPAAVATYAGVSLPGVRTTASTRAAASASKSTVLTSSTLAVVRTPGSDTPA